VSDRSMSVSMTLTEMQDTRGKFFRWISLITVYRLKNNQIRQDITRGEGRISRCQPRPYHRGLGPALPILGFLSIYVYTLCRRTTKFDPVIYMGKAVF